VEVQVLRALRYCPTGGDIAIRGARWSVVSLARAIAPIEISGMMLAALNDALLTNFSLIS